MLRKFVHGLAAVVLIVSLCELPAVRAADQADVSDDVRAALKKLDSGDDRTAKSRLTLAKIAIDSAENAKDPAIRRADYEAARDVLVDAAKLEPDNKDVADLLASVKGHLPAAVPATNPAVPPPATNPGPATKPAGEALVVKRQVTAAEINRIRQLEWRQDETPKPVIRVDADVRKKFLASTTDPTPAEFNKMTPDEQAVLILQSPKPEFRSGVHIMTDPASLKEFKNGVDRIAGQSCATAGCHANNKAGRFNLYPEKTDPAIYTNFLILQKYAARVNGAERLMVDRTTPESSLLLQFMLPPALTDSPHPDVPGFKAPVRNTSDPRYIQISTWLKALDSIAPQYGIDLSKDAEPAGAKK